MLNPFHHKMTDDPNSIDGRIAIGYWEDTEKGSTAEQAVAKDWDPDEQQMVIRYLNLVKNDSNDDEDDTDTAEVNVKKDDAPP